MRSELDYHWCSICKEEIHYLRLEDHEEWHRETWIDGEVEREIEHGRNA